MEHREWTMSSHASRLRTSVDHHGRMDIQNRKRASITRIWSPRTSIAHGYDLDVEICGWESCSALVRKVHGGALGPPLTQCRCSNGARKGLYRMLDKLSWQVYSEQPITTVLRVWTLDGCIQVCGNADACGKSVSRQPHLDRGKSLMRLATGASSSARLKIYCVADKQCTGN